MSLLRYLRLSVSCCLVAMMCSASGKGKKPKVSELLREANALMDQAQDAYVNGESRQALEFYRKALEEISSVEQTHPERVATSEFAPVRFRKALCETEIDRIMLDDASARARTVAVTDTSALERKRAERLKAAATNMVSDTALELTAKSEEGGAVSVRLQENNAEEAQPRAEQGEEINIKDELEWAKDMLSMDRYTDVEKSLLKVLKQEPDHREARLIMAVTRLQQGNHQDAAVVLEDLREDFPADEAVLLLMAGAQTLSGKYVKAMETLDQAMKSNPLRPAGYHNMAWLLLDMNPTGVDDAERYYRRAVALGGSRDRDLERRLGIRAE